LELSFYYSPPPLPLITPANEDLSPLSPPSSSPLPPLMVVVITRSLSSSSSSSSSSPWGKGAL